MNSLLGGIAAASFAIGWWIRAVLFVDSIPCPACAVTCGSLTCPTVHCASGATESVGSIITFGFIPIIVVIVIGGFIKWQSSDIVGGPVRTSSVDGRRTALGQSASWKPLPG